MTEIETTKEKLERVEAKIQAVAAMVRAGVPVWQAWVLVEAHTKDGKEGKK